MNLLNNFGPAQNERTFNSVEGFNPLNAGLMIYNMKDLLQKKTKSFPCDKYSGDGTVEGIRAVDPSQIRMKQMWRQ